MRTTETMINEDVFIDISLFRITNLFAKVPIMAAETQNPRKGSNLFFRRDPFVPQEGIASKRASKPSYPVSDHRAARTRQWIERRARAIIAKWMVLAWSVSSLPNDRKSGS